MGFVKINIIMILNLYFKEFFFISKLNEYFLKNL